MTRVSIFSKFSNFLLEPLPLLPLDVLFSCETFFALTNLLLPVGSFHLFSRQLLADVSSSYNVDLFEILFFPSTGYKLFRVSLEADGLLEVDPNLFCTGLLLEDPATSPTLLELTLSLFE